MERRFVVRALGLAVMACALLGGAGVAAAQVSIVTVPVGNAGNAADTTGYGSVSYAYSIGKYDVTAGQYTAFLNAVATTSDPQGLYNSNMGSGNPTYGCGIAQTYNSGTGTYTYTTTKNPNFPVNFVSFWDACRFTNWLQNGQPTGVAEIVGTTETGAYDLTNTMGITNNTITRSTGASWAVTSENEWYKAAYYDPNKNGVGQAGYWAYPTKSNNVPTNVLSATDTNNANFIYYNGTDYVYTDPVNYLTAVGAFAASPSAYGTYDQGGDVWQWNEANIHSLFRGQRGGAFNYYGGNGLQSDYRSFGNPWGENYYSGIRVSQVPEPASLGILTIGVIGMLVRRRGGRR